MKLWRYIYMCKLLGQLRTQNQDLTHYSIHQPKVTSMVIPKLQISDTSKKMKQFTTLRYMWNFIIVFMKLDSTHCLPTNRQSKSKCEDCKTCKKNYLTWFISSRTNKLGFNEVTTTRILRPSYQFCDNIHINVFLTWITICVRLSWEVETHA